MAKHSFGKANRLLNSHEYQQVFDNVISKGGNRYILLLATENQLDIPRLGLIVPKKKVRFAPDRNRFKRLMREYFRLHKDQLSGLDIIAMARADISQEDKAKQNHLVKQAFERLLTNRPDTAIIGAGKQTSNSDK